jgi:VanZ family protein
LRDNNDGEFASVKRLITTISTITLIMLLLYWPLMFFLTHRPVVPKVIPRFPDYILHFVGYACLGLLFGVRAKLLRRATWTRFTIAMLVIAGYAALDELTQPYFRRQADWKDWLADLLGAMAGWWLGWLLVVLGRWILQWRRSGRIPPHVEVGID